MCIANPNQYLRNNINNYATWDSLHIQRAHLLYYSIRALINWIRITIMIFTLIESSLVQSVTSILLFSTIWYWKTYTICPFSFYKKKFPIKIMQFLPQTYHFIYFSILIKKKNVSILFQITEATKITFRYYICFPTKVGQKVGSG